MRNRVFQLISAFGLLILLTRVAPATHAATTIPAGFEDALVTEVPAPTALAFVTPTRLLITSQPGQLWVYQNGAKVADPALDLTIGDKICANAGSERGLLGVA